MMRTRNQFVLSVATVGLLLLVGGCGTSDDLGGGEDLYTACADTHIILTEFALSQDSVLPGESFTVGWNADYCTAGNVYHFEFHLAPALGSAAELDSSTKLFGRNCGMLEECGTVTCVSEVYQNQRRIDCEGSQTVLAPGFVNAVAVAYGWGDLMDEVRVSQETDFFIW